MCEAKPSERSIPHLIDAVEDELSLDAYFELTSAEIPKHKARRASAVAD